MQSFIRRFSPVSVMLALLICPMACNNNPSVTPTVSAASVVSSLPQGFEGFDEYRVFARYPDSINGYDVKVMILPTYRTWRGTCRAIIDFSNSEGSYKIVHDGWVDSLCFDEGTQTLLMPKDTVITLPYEMPKVPAKKPFVMETFAKLPFFFYDIDFDGKDELLIKLYGQAQRWLSAYEVVEMQPDRLYSIYRKPPFTDLDDMTIIDSKNKTITINDYEGHGEEWHTVYKLDMDESISLSPIATKVYVDDKCFWGVEGDTIPMYRRIYTHEVNDTTGWMPIPD